MYPPLQIEFDSCIRPRNSSGLHYFADFGDKADFQLNFQADHLNALLLFSDKL